MIYVLKFGVLGFIENHEDKVAFLKCKAHGQCSWLKHGLDFSISDATADELAVAAKL